MSPLKLTSAEQKIISIHEKLEKPNAFIRALDIPGDIAPAVMTGRPELIRMATPRTLNPEECKVVYQLIGGLLETNAALQEHAAAVAEFAQNIRQNLRGSVAMADRLERLAAFGPPVEPNEEES